MNRRKIKSPIKKKILLVLAGGLALGLARNPKTQRYVFKSIIKEWKNIDKKYLYRVIKEFEDDRLIGYKEKADGSVEMVLTEKGKRIVLDFNIDNIKITKPVKWDNKWRMVMFDIPEKRRSERNILREKLKEIGFKEIQKSVFVHPYPCLNEINFVIEYFKLRKLVRYGEVTNISNQEDLILKFKLF